MTQFNDSGEARSAPSGGHSAPRRSRFSRVAGVTALAVGVALAAQGVQSSGSVAMADAPAPRAARALAPPAGTTWIVGTLTDQAAHGQDNVSVQALTDGGTTAAATALTYGGPNYNDVSAHGFFRLEVPSDQAYQIVFSGVGGREDGDAFRMQRYGSGRPILARTSSLAAGRIRNLGKIQLVRQGKVTSKIKASVPRAAAKVQTGERGKIKVAVTSRYVTNVKGPVVVKVDGKKLKGKLNAADHGKLTVKLPKFRKPGKQKIVAQFLGTNTVKSDKSKPVTVKVVGKK